MTDESEFETNEERRDGRKESLSEMMSLIKEINTKVTSLAAGMTGVKAELEGVKGQVTGIRTEMAGFRRELQEVRERVKEQEDVISELRERLKRLETKQVPNGDKVNQLTGLILREESVRRGKNLIVNGLEPLLTQGRKFEQCRETATWLINSRLSTDVEVKEARRLGKPKVEGGTAPMLITLGNTADKWTILRSCSKLKGTRIRVNEDLPLEVRMARRPYIPAFYVYKRRGGRVKWEGERLLVDGRELTKQELDGAREEFFKERANRKGSNSSQNSGGIPKSGADCSQE
jgi:hypothetical protein